MRRRIVIAAIVGGIFAGGIAFFVWSNMPPLPPVSSSVSVPLSHPAEETGALIDTRMTSTVGVVLDEIPQKERERLLEDLLHKPLSYWEKRATKQVRFTTLRRNYGVKYGEKSVPLPPEELWNVLVTSEPRRTLVDGHDAVVIDYSYRGTLLTDLKSPAASASALGKIGGIWEDTLLLPLDPEFVFQRTRFACMNESESPPNSMDAEEADFYYDQKCRVEETLTNIGCHQTELPTESCEEAVVAHIGAARPVMTFERLPWSAALADQVRTGHITSEIGPDLQPIASRFQEHRFTYRYIPEDSCTLIERCVGGSGWRQLLTFPTGDLNTGSAPLDIGRVDYFHTEGGSLLADHGVYELSACHGHYHFSHYGSFTLGDGSKAITHKQGFCLQPTSRLMNNELSPMNHPYANCIDQGVAVGWIDEYNMGLECQWLDVSDVAPQRLPLSFTTNPDGMMCEGERKFDARGRQIFVPTTFRTNEGEPVDRPLCEFIPGWDDNNTVSYSVDVPANGESYVTQRCAADVFGPLRNCGLTRVKKQFECDPGSPVTLHCTVPAGSASQMLRVCEASRALKTGIPCTSSDALATQIMQSSAEVRFTCPAARDARETGGVYSFLTGALFPEQPAATVTCAVVEPTL